ncbi:MAG: hypothetical protein JNL38_35395 [Myxococcales bacterium]|jgi:polyhydroxybutyrate depolymerase|nr:hypothetical protein [Myxococcales bacterium]
MRAKVVMAALSLASSLGAGCVPGIDECHAGDVGPGGSITCPVPSWTDRAFDLEVPAGWDGRTPLPVVFAFHGGGGNRRAAATVTCRDGDVDRATCLSAVARASGFAVVRPDGTGSRPLRNVRTWNAGGGAGSFNCASGPACKSGVDDMRYFDDLLRAVRQVVPVDPKRVHLTGLSNGAAISHRIACERSGVVASIVAVGGTNQHAGTGGACAPGVAVLQIHGTEDPCWGYTQGTESCLESNDPGTKIGVEESMEGWRFRNTCATAPDEAPLPDNDPGDGTRATRRTYRGCRAAVELVRVEGGGHTWPDGNPYFPQSIVGRVSRDFGSDLIVEFFRAHPRP